MFSWTVVAFVPRRAFAMKFLTRVFGPFGVECETKCAQNSRYYALPRLGIRRFLIRVLPHGLHRQKADLAPA